MAGILRRLASGRAGPTTLAVALAIVATPLVALSFLAPPLFEVDDSFRPPGMVVALLVAAAATIGAAVVAGTAAGVVVRRRPTLGALIAFALAWPLAVTIPPIAAMLLGQGFETAYACFDDCGSMIHTADALSGAGAYLVALFVSGVTIVPLVAFGFSLFGGYRLNQKGYPVPATVVLGLGYGSLHWIAVLGGAPPLIGFACLVAGVAAWTWALRDSPAEAAS